MNKQIAVFIGKVLFVLCLLFSVGNVSAQRRYYCEVKGIEKELVAMLGGWNRIPVTYAGGVHSYEDLYLIKELGKNHLNVTIGSALDLFGGSLKWEEVLAIMNKKTEK